MAYDDEEFDVLDDEVLESDLDEDYAHTNHTSYNYDDDDYSFDDEDDDNSYELD